jgi:hypothetical protein
MGGEILHITIMRSLTIVVGLSLGALLLKLQGGEE